MKTSSLTKLLFLMVVGVAAGSAVATAQNSASSASSVTADGAADLQHEASSKAQTPMPPDAQSQAMPGDSHVRIVRLSEVRGAVQMDRRTGQGMEPTMQNMPIVEGAKLATGGDGLAEVEFEDGSTLRLAPGGLIEFPQLVRRSGGATASTVKLVNGLMYVSLAGTKGNSLILQVGKNNVTVAPSTHLRVDMGGSKITFAVFEGNAEVQQAAGATLVGKKQTLTEDTEKAGQVNLAKNVPPVAYDEWDKDSISYQKRYTKGNAFASSPYTYGVSDLNYYGSFFDAGGCGRLWQPYFVSASWSPYGNGLWAWYPGAGYSWVSPYPWGWMPYHSGEWAYCPTRGWGWRPGNNWNGLQNTAGLVKQPLGPTPVPLRPHPPQPPAPGRSTLVVSNTAPIAVSKMSTADRFEFRNNSAGLGVPRGSLGNLGKISNGVEQHGLVAKPVYALPTGTAGGAGSETAHGLGQGTHGGPVTLRQGSVESRQAAGGQGSSPGGLQSGHAGGGSQPVSNVSGGGMPSSRASSPAMNSGGAGGRAAPSPK